MRVVVVGGSLVGLTLARALAKRGHEPVVLERGRGEVRGDPLFVPYQAYDALADVGVMDAVQREGMPIAATGPGPPPGYGFFRRSLTELLAEGVPVEYEQSVVGLIRAGGEDGRIVGVRVRGPDGVEREIGAELVVGADGAASPVRALAGIPGETVTVDDGWLGALGAPDPERSFAMRFLSDGRQIGLYAAPGISFIFWQIGRVGREAALAPELERFRAAVQRLLPEAQTALEGVNDRSQLVYWEALEVRGCQPWWVPGAVVIGDAAHALTPEAGLGSGLGMGDALALAEAVRQHPADPDAACDSYERWRRPVVAPYEAIRGGAVRMVPHGAPAEKPPEERWPPEG
jgi:2-polyprenyl-6-methoxyphenol hydroxylase-like FAD-dependent oxidoreductase